MAVALGTYGAFAAVLTEGGGLLVFGQHNYGELGLGAPTGCQTPDRPSPALLGGVGTHITGCEGGGGGADTHPFGNEALVMVAAGGNHVAAVTDRGGVWAWGLNHQEQLGPVPRHPDGLTFRSTPARWDAALCGASPVAMVACGEVHTLALTRAGLVWSCGYGLHGQTGHEYRGRITEPVQVPGVKSIAMVAAGSRYSMAIAADGRLWSWGEDDKCPHATAEPPPHPRNETPYLPRALELSVFGGSAVVSATAGFFYSAAVTTAGELWTWGVHVRAPQLVASAAPPFAGAAVSMAACGDCHAAGAGPPFAGAAVSMAACGDHHVVVLTDSGAVWTFGQAFLGALGHGNDDACAVPTRIAQDRFEGARIVSVAAGLDSSMAVTAEGVLYSWGTGASGHGALDERVWVPTAVPATRVPGSRVARTCALPPGHVLAMCMGVMPRLGDNCVFRPLFSEILERIAAAAGRLSGAYLHMGEGLLRMVAVRLRAG